MVPWLDKKKGDPLLAREFNRVAKAAFRNDGPGTGVGTVSIPSVRANNTFSPFRQHVVTVTGLQSGHENYEGLYTCTVRAPDPSNTSEGWGDVTGTWNLDAREVLGPPNGDGRYVPYLSAGQKVLCYLDRQAGCFVPIYIPLRVRFVLKDDLEPGGEVDAYLMRGNGSDFVVDENITFPVWDHKTVCRGRKKGKFSSPNDTGSWGVAEYDWSVQACVIEEFVGQAHRIRGLTTGAVAAGDSTFTIDGVNVMGPPGSHITDQDPAGSITVYKPEDQSEADNDGYCEAVWDESQDHWVCDVLECPA